ncbi:MAG TPA: PrsW family glutamic-type intramembrane protease, partial [Candidatus Binatia bacterium]|nr:PrsW family glutamic-type intramembrane protease [Candidatus Binatia bacterium]
MAFAALFAATAVPLIFLYLVHTLDLYGTGSSRAIALSFAWGAFSVLIAFAVYHLVQVRLGLIQGTPLVLYIAPALEETLKALVLLYLVRRSTFTYFVDGAIYGFAAGIGFAVFENVVYVYQNLDTGLGTALGRVLSTNLMHASAGAIVGIALGLARFRRFRRRALLLLVGLFLATLLHAAFNRLVMETGQRRLFFYAMGIGLSGAA